MVGTGVRRGVESAVGVQRVSGCVEVDGSVAGYGLGLRWWVLLGRNISEIKTTRYVAAG